MMLSRLGLLWLVVMLSLVLGVAYIQLSQEVSHVHSYVEQLLEKMDSFNLPAPNTKELEQQIEISEKRLQAAVAEINRYGRILSRSLRARMAYAMPGWILPRRRE